MIMPWDATPLSNRRPTYSRPARSEMLPRHQNHVPQSQQPIHLRSGMSCPRICVTPSSNSVTENWTSFLRWRSMRQNGEADCRGVLEQNPHRLDAHLTYRSPSVSAVASGLLAKTPYLAALAPIAPAFRPNARAPAFAPNRNKTKKKLAKRRPAGSSGSVCWRSASAPPRTRETCVPLR